MPEQAIIDQYKGKIDFYLFKGIPCARKWPVHKPRIPSPQEQAARDNFALASKLWYYLPPEDKEAYSAQAQGTPLTGRDLFTKAYLSGLKY